MIKLGKRDAMIVVCGSNRIRLYKYKHRPDFDGCADYKKVADCYRLRSHYKKCGRIIKLFVKAAK